MPGTRPLEVSDSGAVLQINAASLPAVARLDATELARLMGISRLHLAAFMPDGRLAGYALVFASEHGYDGEEFGLLRSKFADGFVYVDQVAVAPSCRGAGVGRALYDAIAALAYSLGAKALCCEVNLAPPNPDSLVFHQRMGFARIGELATQDGREVALLHRPL